MALSGLTALSGINGVQVDTPEATPEQRMGGTADPYHAHWGEQASPYPWESSLTMSGSHGPYGPENQLLDDPEYWFLEPAGNANDDPAYDYNTPYRNKSHASVHNVTNSGPALSHADAIQFQVEQSASNHSSNLGTSRGMQEWDSPQQDNWLEIWNVTPGHTDIPKAPGAIGNNAFGYGVNDRPMNAYRKQNDYGYDSAHFHRRYAFSSIPGNNMWMRPGGRVMRKTLPGPSRPPIGDNSPFQGDDLGQAFAYDNGAILQSVPQEYVPPPSPNIQAITPVYADPMGTDGVDLW